jgi:hypothetical protein
MCGPFTIDARGCYEPLEGIRLTTLRLALIAMIEFVLSWPSLQK